MQSTDITLDTTVCRSENQVSTELNGEIILMSIEQGTYYGMDPVLSSIWNLIEKPLPVSALCKRLQEEYEVNKETCEYDVMEALRKLADEHLITITA